MSSGQLSIIFSGTPDTWTQSNRETFIRQLLDNVGPIYPGQEISRRISIQPNNHFTVITITASCVRNSDMVPTTEASPQLSPNKPASPSESSNSSNLNTSPLSPPTCYGTSMLSKPYLEKVISQLSQVVEGGSMDDEMTPPLSAKQLLTILKAALQT